MFERDRSRLLRRALVTMARRKSGAAETSDAWSSCASPRPAPPSPTRPSSTRWGAPPTRRPGHAEEMGGQGVQLDLRERRARTPRAARTRAGHLDQHLEPGSAELPQRRAGRWRAGGTGADHARKGLCAILSPTTEFADRSYFATDMDERVERPVRGIYAREEAAGAGASASGAGAAAEGGAAAAEEEQQRQANEQRRHVTAQQQRRRRRSGGSTGTAAAGSNGGGAAGALECRENLAEEEPTERPPLRHAGRACDLHGRAPPPRRSATKTEAGRAAPRGQAHRGARARG